MNLRTRVKICGITTADAAESAVEAGADALGLVFYEPSKRYIKVDTAIEIANVVPAFVSLVGLFVDSDKASINKVLKQVPLQLLQFHGNESASFCESFGVPYIKALRVKDGMDIPELVRSYPTAKAILLDTYKENTPGGTGEVFDWSLVPELADRIILAGGLCAKNVGQAISAVKPYAVDTSGGVESAPGVKDPARIRAFISQVLQTDANLNA